MPSQTKWRNVGWKTSTFFIQRLQTFFFHFCHVFFTFFKRFFIYFSGTFFYIYGRSHRRTVFHCYKFSSAYIMLLTALSYRRCGRNLRVKLYTAINPLSAIHDPRLFYSVNALRGHLLIGLRDNVTEGGALWRLPAQLVEFGLLVQKLNFARMAFISVISYFFRATVAGKFFTFVGRPIIIAITLNSYIILPNRSCFSQLSMSYSGQIAWDLKTVLAIILGWTFG